jgi:uncharacterized membrane protein YhaH (DUF805 family)
MRNFWSTPFRFRGRISRKQYWTATLTYVFFGMLGAADNSPPCTKAASVITEYSSGTTSWQRACVPS